MLDLFKKKYENITSQEVSNVMNHADVMIIDVRESHEYSRGHIPKAKLIPLGTIEQRLAEIDKSKKIIVVCASGGRSSRAASFLGSAGYQVSNMMGGMMAWAGPTKN
ncbi:MAG: rhodanese-like domain-containing protein [Vallitaleaceae bacterium]|nr:rhodanese-like domain-containing protein [Vallitaleaceae bacterium]